MMMNSLEVAMSRPSKVTRSPRKPKASEVTKGGAAPVVPASSTAPETPSQPSKSSTAPVMSPPASTVGSTSAPEASDTAASPSPPVSASKAAVASKEAPPALAKVEEPAPAKDNDETVGAATTSPSSAASVPVTETMADGRRVIKCVGESAAATVVVAEVAAVARAAIQDRGAFSIAVSGDDAADALAALAQEKDLDFSAFHVFFSYDKLGKLTCYEQVLAACIKKCNIPATQVHSVSPDALADGTGAAAQYTANMCMQEENVIVEGEGGLPSMDVVLLSTRDDGTVGGLTPGSLASDDLHSGQ
eukprot:4838703-Amphidinium_carterae.1